MGHLRTGSLPRTKKWSAIVSGVGDGSDIHNSNYSSVDDCKNAIDRYFKERNENYKKNPKKAGNKIWGKELVEPVFIESNNCKNSKW